MTSLDLLLGKARTSAQRKARRRAAFAVALRHEREYQEAYAAALDEQHLPERGSATDPASIARAPE